MKAKVQENARNEPKLTGIASGLIIFATDRLILSELMDRNSRSIEAKLKLTAYISKLLSTVDVTSFHSFSEFTLIYSM
jgi:hypothetical protein